MKDLALPCRYQKHLLLVALLSFLIASCSNDKGGGGGTSVSPVLPYCETITVHADAITVTGTANYEYRNNGNGAVTGPNPIRYAEIRVLDSAGNIIQCGETTGTGTFSLSLPNNGDTATIQVNSRASNNNAVAYVLNNPTSNSFHSLTTSITLSGSQNVGTLTAPATGDVLGGAFNILDQIVNANSFLSSETAGCDGTYSTCNPFTVAPLVTIYWTKGINPATYFNSFTPLSFYLPGDRELYILGGVSGDVDSSDTDHFDNSIILHEYAHFLEDVYSKSDSPGGSHNGNSIIDPRLAWGEGWANYFQAAVTGNPFYVDTSGNVSGTAQTIFNEPLETPNNDIPTTMGQGTFREFSISRALWDITDNVNDAGDTVSSTFSEVWNIFNGDNLFPSTNRFFRNMGLLHFLQASQSPKADWSSVQAAEMQRTTLEDYANTLTLGGACGSTTIQAADISGAQPENGTFTNSNQFASNDFYQYTHTGGAFSFALSYTTTGANPADLDVFVYDNDYTYGSSSDVVGSSDATINVGQSSGSENINLSSLAAGTYMINIQVYTGARLGSSADYDMTINSQTACPD